MPERTIRGWPAPQPSTASAADARLGTSIGFSHGTMAHDPPLALSALRNLGPRSAEMLARAGIRTPEQLRRAGAVAAYRRTRRVVPGASLNLLYALVGAIENRDWREVRRNDRLALLLSVDGMDRNTAADAALLALRNILNGACNFDSW